ncbi:hypothetical protein D3C87_1473530 [compost metagenome]
MLEQFLRIRGEPAWRRHPGPDPRRFEVQQQPRPFETVAGRGAVGAETVGRIGVVVFAQRLPVAIEMLDHQVVVGGGVRMDNALDDALGADQPAVVPGDVGQGEEGFGGVHVAVGAAVGFLAAEVAVEGFAHRALLLAPEMRVDDVDRINE